MRLSGPLDFALSFGTTDPALRPQITDVLVLNGSWSAPTIKLEHRADTLHRPVPVKAPVAPAGK